MVTGNRDDEAGDDLAPRFRALWIALTDVMGSSATATLLRRAAKSAASREPQVADLVIKKPSFEYEYVPPAAWRDPHVEARAVRTLLQALEPLLVELTGEIVINRLRAIPEVRALLSGEKS